MVEKLVSFVPLRPRGRSSGIAATLEIALVLGISFAVAAFGQSLLEPSIAQTLGFDGGNLDLRAASGAMLKQFAMQYGVLLLLVTLIGFWRRRRSAAAYALGRGSLGGMQIVHYGIVMGLVAGIPATALLMLQQYAPIGADPPMWTALRSAPKDFNFWLFMAVASFAVVPILEEATWRGYALGRLTEALAPGAAVVVAAVPFALAHTQYSGLDPAMMLATISVLTGSLAGAFATLRTGSIWPAVIAHAIINFPIEGWLGFAKLGLAVIVVLLVARPILAELKRWALILFRRDTFQSVPPLTLLAAIAAVIFWAGTYAYWIVAALAIAAVAGIAKHRSNWDDGRHPGDGGAASASTP